jgi:hypothetical protein
MPVLVDKLFTVEQHYFSIKPYFIYTVTSLPQRKSAETLSVSERIIKFLCLDSKLPFSQRFTVMCETFGSIANL